MLFVVYIIAHVDPPLSIVLLASIHSAQSSLPFRQLLLAAFHLYVMPGGFVDTTGPKVARPADLSARQALPAILVASFAAFGGILYGYDTGTISGVITMQSFLRDFGKPNPAWPSPDAAIKEFYLPTNDVSLVTSILSAGTFVGALSGAPISDYFGRRIGLHIAMAVFCVGVAMQVGAMAGQLGLFTAGRVVAGLGVGIVSTIVPMYQSECAPRWIRGAVVSGYQWAITIGLFLASIVNYATENRVDTGAYRIPVGVQLAFAIILSAGLLFLPESPRWLVKKGRHEDAARSLGRLNSSDLDDPLVRTELADIQTNLEIELTHGTGSYADCFKFGQRQHFTRTMTGIFLQAWQQLTGVNFIFYYGTRFFATAIPSQGNPFLFSVATNVVNVFMTLPGMYWMERVGRRNLLIYGAIWMMVCELIVGCVGTTLLDGKTGPDANGGAGPNTAAGGAVVAFVCLYIAGFASTWGPAAWVVCGEIFPLAIRAKALSMCTASNWLWNFALGYATPYLVDPPRDGQVGANLLSKVFFIWTGTCAGCAIFAYFLIFETKGLSLEEVDEMYSQTNAIRSPQANKEIRSRRTDVEGLTARPLDDEAAENYEKKEDVVYQTA